MPHGESGTGRSHLLIGLGTAAAKKGYREPIHLSTRLLNERVEAADEGWTRTFTDPRLFAAVVDRRTFGANIETGIDSNRLAHMTAQQTTKGSNGVHSPVATENSLDVDQHQDVPGTAQPNVRPPGSVLFRKRLSVLSLRVKQDGVDAQGTPPVDG